MKNDLNQFRQDNTSGYSDDELDVMNYELAELLDEAGYETIDDVDDSLLKFRCEQILNKHS